MSDLKTIRFIVLVLAAFIADPRLGVSAQPTTQPTTRPTSQPVTAIITKLQSSVIAGEGVEVNALNSKINVGSPLTTTYKWDFGDPAGAFNNLTGWNAGHIYAAPGRYTITLQLTDSAGSTSTATTEIAVNADRRNVIYVDGHGSDEGAGTSVDRPVKTAGRAFSLARNNTKILLHRGDSFKVTSTLWLNGRDQAVGAYGNGASPVLMFAPTDSSQATIFVGRNASNITIQDLTFDSPHAVTRGPAGEIVDYAIWAGGTNLVVAGNTFNNVNDAVNGTQNPTGVIVQNNSAPLLKGMRGYLCWVDGNNWSILGNTVANSTRQHCVRVNSADVVGVLISGNNLTKQCPYDDPGEAIKDTVNVRIGSYVYVANNVLSDCPCGISPSPGQTADQQVNWCVWEGNYINNGQLIVDEVGHHVMLRDNVLNITGTAQINIMPTGPTVSDSTVTDLTIEHNTGINTGQDGEFIGVTSEPAPHSITIKNNLDSAPHMRFGFGWDSGVWINAPDLKGFASITNNIWPTANNLQTPNVVNWVAGMGYLTEQGWNSLPGVSNDQYSNQALPIGKYQLTVNGVTAGARNVATPQPPTRPTTQPGVQPTTQVAKQPATQPTTQAMAGSFHSTESPAADLQNLNDPGIPPEGVELGTKFQSSVPGYVTGVRFFKGSLNTGTHTGELWNADGTKLATATFADESDSGWQHATFSSPVRIAANTTYVVSYHTNAQYIAYSPSGFTDAMSNPPLMALASGAADGNGVYQYGPSAFPTTHNGQSPDYWVDVIFSPTAPR